MRPQHAHRLFAAVAAHGVDFLTYVDQFVNDGDTQAEYIHSDGLHLTFGLDAYDMYAVRFDRVAAKKLAAHVRRVGLKAFISECVDSLKTEQVKRNPPVAMVSRNLDHRPSHLHRSAKTRRAKHATHKGRQTDARKAAEFRATCSTPYMTPAGRVKDSKPITIHTPRPIGAHA